MAGLLFAGCLFLAYGPSVIMLLGLFVNKSYLFIATITSAFVWLLGLLIVAVVWYMVPPLRTLHGYNVAMTSAIMELVRYGFLRLYMKGETRLTRALPHTLETMNDFTFSLAAGLGFALMQNVIMYGATIAAAHQESYVYLSTCAAVPLPVLSAIVALLLSLSHLCLMILGLDALRRSSAMRYLVVFIAHITFSELTLLSETKDGCQGELPLLSALVIVEVLWTAHIVLSTGYAGRIQAAAAASRADTVAVSHPHHHNQQHHNARQSLGADPRTTTLADSVAASGGGVEMTTRRRAV